MPRARVPTVVPEWLAGKSVQSLITPSFDPDMVYVGACRTRVPAIVHSVSSDCLVYSSLSRVFFLMFLGMLLLVQGKASASIPVLGSVISLHGP